MVCPDILSHVTCVHKHKDLKLTPVLAQAVMRMSLEAANVIFVNQFVNLICQFVRTETYF